MERDNSETKDLETQGEPRQAEDEQCEAQDTQPQASTWVQASRRSGVSAVGTPSTPEDPFDLNRLRLSQDFDKQVGVKKALLTVPVRKPNRQEFIWVHPDEAYRLQTAVIEIKEDREVYLVDPRLREDLPDEVVAKTLFATINRQGVVFLWPVRLPGPDGRIDHWSRSSYEAAELAMKGWVRVVANLSLGAYDVYQATGNLSEPVWPEENLQSLLRIAFKDKLIQSLDHPILRRLRGEV